jgi:hypothetical protein
MLASRDSRRFLDAAAAGAAAAPPPAAAAAAAAAAASAAGVAQRTSRESPVHEPRKTRRGPREQAQLTMGPPPTGVTCL